MGCIYRILFPNKKSYIGATKSDTPEGRVIGHFRRNKFLVGNAIRKYGFDEIDISILAYNPSWVDLLQLERKYIKKFNTLCPNGYNLTGGGEGALDRVASKHSRNQSRKTIRKVLARLHKDPDFKARHKIRARKTLARLKADPEFRAAQMIASSNNMFRLNADPEFQVKRDIAIEQNLKLGRLPRKHGRKQWARMTDK